MPIRRYPDLVVHRALLHELGSGDDPPPEDLAGLAEHTSAREREAADVEYRADDICLAWLLERELFERGWESAWEGEIGGVIDSGLFVRFGDVFEGYLPARFSSLAPLTALLAFPTRRSWAWPTGHLSRARTNPPDCFVRSDQHTDLREVGNGAARSLGHRSRVRCGDAL